MKIYLAASFSRQDEMKKVAKLLRKKGYTITSRWLKEPQGWEHNHFTLGERAQWDLEDMLSSDILIRFTDDLSAPMVPSHLATGSRMWETGACYIAKKVIVVVGGEQCVFDSLPDIVHVKNIKRLLKKLEKIKWKCKNSQRGQQGLRRAISPIQKVS